MLPPFGHVLGYPPGAVFANRLALSQAGVHRPRQAGICGTAGEGAESVVLSGGYGDDDDRGDVIVYTGRGGRSASSGRQVADQDLNRDNQALATSALTGRPVRVARQLPTGEYSYDGLYRVERFAPAEGRDGFLIWRFELHRLGAPASDLRYGTAPDPPSIGEPGALPASGDGPTPRVEAVVQRLVRSTACVEGIKRLHGHRCQACGIRLVTAAGPYAEGAHIRPLGRPHDGPDAPGNVLCLCPNHHALFDLGAWTVAEDLALIGLPGALRTHPKHPLDAAHLAYHRDRYAPPPTL